jgi:putative ABC transport system ATP-binding protein
VLRLWSVRPHVGPGIDRCERHDGSEWTGKRRAQWRAAKVGYVFQSFNLVPYLTVGENVAIALRLSGVASNGKGKCSRAVEEVGLADRVHHLPSELSVGEQQRVALARALVKNPELILADEPTGNLDPGTAAEVMNVLCRLNGEGKTVVMITHDPNIAGKANRIVRISDGKLAV